MWEMIRRWLGTDGLVRELLADNERLQAECERLRGRITANREVHERSLSALRDAVETAVADRDEALRQLDELKQLLATEKAEGNETARRLKEVELERGRARDERDYVRRQRDEALRDVVEYAPRLKVVEAERDELAGRLKVAEAERDAARGEWDRWALQALTDRKANTEALAALREQVEKVIAERDEAQSVAITLANQKAAAERDASDLRLTLKIVVRNLRKLADDIEPTDDSPEDRPGTDEVAAEPRPPESPLVQQIRGMIAVTDPVNLDAYEARVIDRNGITASTASMTIVIPGRRVDLADRTANE